MPGPPDPAAALREQHPGWTIWVSGTGRWWASRLGELTAAEAAAGCAPFLHADDPARQRPIRASAGPPLVRAAVADPAPAVPSPDVRHHPPGRDLLRLPA